MKIGEHTYGQPNLRMYSGDSDDGVTIGKYCSISNEVIFFPGGNHPTCWVSTFPFHGLGLLPGTKPGMPCSDGPITVGNDVWLGYHTTVLSGVTIGDGAVVGAYAVVAHDVPAYAVAVGNPARVARYRFSEAQIAALLRIRWWDWPYVEVLRAVWLLSSPEIDMFIQAYDPEPEP